MNKAVIAFFQKQPAPECCFYCGIKLVRLRLETTPHPMAKFVHNLLSRDHVEPMSLGGSKKKRNIVLCCRKCNNAKGKRTVEQYRRFLHGDKPVEFYAEQLYREETE